MPGSQLTLRTLGLAMVALVLACVHAARGDGRGGSIASHSFGARTGNSVVRSGGGGGSSIATVRGDPWVAGPEKRSTSTSSSSVRLPVMPDPRISVKGHPRDHAGPHEAPVCIVRRAGENPADEPAPPQLMGPPPPPAPIVADANHPLPLRNAFALTASMAAGMP